MVCMCERRKERVGWIAWTMHVKVNNINNIKSSRITLKTTILGAVTIMHACSIFAFASI